MENGAREEVGDLGGGGTGDWSGPGETEPCWDPVHVGEEQSHPAAASRECGDRPCRPVEAHIRC